MLKQHHLYGFTASADALAPQRDLAGGRFLLCLRPNTYHYELVEVGNIDFCDSATHVCLRLISPSGLCAVSPESEPCLVRVRSVGDSVSVPAYLPPVVAARLLVQRAVTVTFKNESSAIRDMDFRTFSRWLREHGACDDFVGLVSQILADKTVMEIDRRLSCLSLAFGAVYGAKLVDAVAEWVNEHA